MTPVRKARVRQDAGKKVVTKMERISIKEALMHAALSKRGKSWAAIRGDIQKALLSREPGKSISSTETVAIECQIEGRNPSMQEIISIEGSINKWLAEEVRSMFRIRYLDTINKIVILPESEITALFGKRLRNGASL